MAQKHQHEFNPAYQKTHLVLISAFSFAYPSQVTLIKLNLLLDPSNLTITTSNATYCPGCAH